jgi:hypothetical protein
MTPKEMNLLNSLESEFSKLERFPLSAYPKCKAFMKQAPNEAMTAIRDRKIKFLDTLAISELVSRRLMDEEARFDHAAELIVRGAR